MKWMGGWTPADYDAAPVGLTDEVIALMLEEHQAYEDAKAGRRSSSSSGRIHRESVETPAPAAVPGQIAAGVDPRTGREVVTVTKPDGTVVKHRKIEEGERIIHQMFGKPKSFQNK